MKTLTYHSFLAAVIGLSFNASLAQDVEITTQEIKESFRYADYDTEDRWVFDLNGEIRSSYQYTTRKKNKQYWWLEEKFLEESENVGLTASDDLNIDLEGDGWLRMMCPTDSLFWKNIYLWNGDAYELYSSSVIGHEWNKNQASYIQCKDSLHSKDLTVYAEFEFKIYYNQYHISNFYAEESASNGLLFFLYDADKEFQIGDRRSAMGYSSLSDDGYYQWYNTLYRKIPESSDYNGYYQWYYGTLYYWGPYSWGYTNDGTGSQDEQDGMKAAYIGIGFDVDGGFTHTRCKNGGKNTMVENSITLRGNEDSGYEYLVSTADDDVPDLDYDFYVIDEEDDVDDIQRPTGYYNLRKAVIVIDANNQLTVFLKARTDSLKPVFSADLSDYERPENISLGFTAGTGNSTATIEIRDLYATAFSALLWDNDSNDSLWDTNENWETDNTPEALGLEDVSFSDTYVSSAQNVNLNGKHIVRTVNMEGNVDYTLDNGFLYFDAKFTEGLSLSASGGDSETDYIVNCNIGASKLLSISNNAVNELTINGDIVDNSTDIRFTGASKILMNGYIKSETAGGVIKDGTGDLWINGDEANTYSGNTRLTYGTTYLNKDPSSEGKNKALGTGALYVAKNATVQWEADDQINNNSDIILSGGTLNLNGHNEWSE